MCKFLMIVETNSPAQVARATRRLQGDGRSCIPVTVSVEGKKVIAEVDHPEPVMTQIGAAGWAKDWFGMDPELEPSVIMC